MTEHEHELLKDAVRLSNEFFTKVMPKMNVADSALDAEAITIWNTTAIAVTKAVSAIRESETREATREATQRWPG